MTLIDTHAHLDDERYDEDRASVIERMRAADVAKCLTIGTCMETSEAAVALAREHEDIHAIVGTHPHHADTMTNDVLDAYIDMLNSRRAVAMGEIGLDYHYDHSPRDTQRAWFAAQMEAVCALNAPVVIHIREAHGDALDILRGFAGRVKRGVIHCYSGSVESAREYMDMGYSLSFNGVITFKNATKAVEVVRFMPRDRLLLETDCPYLAPDPYRGKRNEPAYIMLVARKVADIWGTDVEEVADITSRNAKKMFDV